MKKFLFLVAACGAILVSQSSQCNADIIITGIIDGGLPGGTPKALELYATTTTDLSTYSIANFNNGGTDPGTTFNLTGTAAAGSFLYVASEAPNFTAYFGFAPTFTSGALNVNGDDAIALSNNAVQTDVFGVIGTDGTGEVWEYLDGWAYRVSNTGPNATFTPSEWTFSGIDVTDGTTTAAQTGFPFGTFNASAVPEPSTFGLLALAGTGLVVTRYRRRKATLAA